MASALLTREEAADALRVHLNTLAKLVLRGELAHVRVGRKIYVPESAIGEYLERNYHPAVAS